MMPTNFKMAQQVLGAPKDWDEKKNGPCGGLPILRAHGCIYSCWKPSFRELLKLLAGHPVQLVVATRSSMPPVAMSVGEPRP